MSSINLDKSKTKAVAKELDLLLADYQLYYQKTRNFHWNVTGKEFFELHQKFEEMYLASQLKIDQIAERILTLGYSPSSNYSEYLKKSNLKESSNKLSDVEMLTILLEDHHKIVKQLRSAIAKANEAQDEGTLDFLPGYVSELEKDNWMLSAWLTKPGDHLPDA